VGSDPAKERLKSITFESLQRDFFSGSTPSDPPSGGGDRFVSAPKQTSASTLCELEDGSGNAMAAAHLPFSVCSVRLDTPATPYAYVTVPAPLALGAGGKPRSFGVELGEGREFWDVPEPEINSLVKKRRGEVWRVLHIQPSYIFFTKPLLSGSGTSTIPPIMVTACVRAVSWSCALWVARAGRRCRRFV